MKHRTNTRSLVSRWRGCGPKDAPCPALLLATLLSTLCAPLGCGNATTEGTEPDGALSETPGGCLKTANLRDANNYSLTTDIRIEMSALKGASDLIFDWSGLTTDFLGQPVNAASDIDLVVLSLWNMSQRELEQRMSTDTLSVNEQKGALTVYPDGTFTQRNLYGFNVFDDSNTPVGADKIEPFFDTTDPDYPYPPSDYTFMVAVASGTAPGQNSRMLSLFKLDTNSTQTTLALKDDSTRLNATATFTQSTPVRVPAATPDIVVDWNEMTKNALGNTYQPRQITKAVVMHFDAATLTELENDFLNLEHRANEWYEGEVTKGTSVDLSTLKDERAQGFQGITASGTWMVALFCTKTCNNPAPWSITLIEPCVAP